MLLALAAIVLMAMPEDVGAQIGGRRGRGDFRRDGGGQRDRGFRFGRGGGFGFPGGGSFGRGGRGGGLLGMLGRESVQTELKLTDAQKTQIEELQERLRSEGPSRSDLFSRLRDASDEERQAMFEQMRADREEQQKKAETELKPILSETQFTRLRQISWHEAGSHALLQDDVVTSLKLTDEQKKSIQAVFDGQEEQRRAQSEQTRDLSREERQQLFDDLRQKAEQEALAALTPEQKQKWNELLGPPPADENGSSAPNDGVRASSPSADGGGRSSGEPRRVPYVFAGDSGPRVASFSGDSGGKEEPSGGSGEGEASAQPQAANTTSDIGGAVNAPMPPKADRTPTLSFNFNNAPWPDVLKLFADAAGLTLHLRDVPSGTFTYHDRREYTPTEALDIMNRYLLQDGYLLIRHDRFLTAFKAKDGIPPNLVETVSLEQLPQRGQTEYVTAVFPLGERKAEKASSEVKALLGPQGTVAPLESANSLVVTDIAANLLRIKEFLQPPPKPADQELTFRPFPLEHVAAADAADIVRKLFGLQSGVQNVSAGQSGSYDSSSRYSRYSRSRFDPREYLRARFGGDRDGREEERDSRSSFLSALPQQPETPTRMSVAVDERTNSLLVTATASQMKLVEQAVEAIDVEEGSSTAAAARRSANEPYLEVYALQSADPREVAKTLGVLHPNNVINEDGHARRIHIWATPEEHRQIAAQIRQLDGALGGSSLAVIPLGGLNPYDAGTMLTSLFLNDGDHAPSIQVDPYGSNLIVRGTAVQVGQIRSLLEQYGAGTSTSAVQQGPVRTIPLGGRDPSEFARLLERIWSASGENPIRVITPQNSSGSTGSEPNRGRRTPTSAPRQRKQSTEEGPQVQRSGGGIDRLSGSASPGGSTQTVPAVFVSSTQDGEQPDQRPANVLPSDQPRPETASQPADEKTLSGTGAKSPIVISVLGDDLVISSADEAALDRLQRLIDRVSRMLPARTQWTVIYLRSADATEAAAMLEQLLPASTGAAQTLVSGMLPLSGTSALRIIPETRMNALFVSGPPEQVRDVKKMLEVLDAAELPESLRDRVPRMIPVLHADVNEVAEIIRNVYDDYMESPNSRFRGRGPFPGFGRPDNNGGSNSQRNPGTQLTLGVDTQTSQLIVSSSEALFRQIEDLVQTLDQSAYEAERTVRVVGLSNANSAVVQDALNSLFPQVTVSTTASSGTGSRPPSANGRSDRTNDRDSDAERAERIRRFMEFRQRMQEQFGGGDRGGDGRPSFGRDRSNGGGFPFGFGRGRDGDRDRRDRDRGDRGRGDRDRGDRDR